MVILWTESYHRPMIVALLFYTLVFPIFLRSFSSFKINKISDQGISSFTVFFFFTTSQKLSSVKKGKSSVLSENIRNLF